MARPTRKKDANNVFFNRLHSAILRSGMSQTQVACALGVASALTAWRNGSRPSYDMLERLANYLDVSVDYLMGRSDRFEVASRSEEYYMGDVEDDNEN